MKNKLLHFALDLFSDSDDEEQDSIFAQVKIYRTTSVRIFEYVIGILLLAIWLLTIVNITHVAAEEWHSCLIIAICGTVSTGLSRLCGMDREREHLLRRNDNMLSPFGSELHILYLQDIQVATSGRSTLLAHSPERETPHRRHIGVDHSCRVRSTLPAVLGQSAKSAEWIFEGLNLLSPDCRHHLGWQQILRSFPRNRQRRIRFSRQTIAPKTAKCCHRSGHRTRQMAAFFHSQHQRPEK